MKLVVPTSTVAEAVVPPAVMAAPVPPVMDQKLALVEVYTKPVVLAH